MDRLFLPCLAAVLAFLALAPALLKSGLEGVDRAADILEVP